MSVRRRIGRYELTTTRVRPTKQTQLYRAGTLKRNRRTAAQTEQLDALEGSHAEP